MTINKVVDYLPKPWECIIVRGHMKTAKMHRVAEWDEEDGRDPVTGGAGRALALVRRLRESLEDGKPTPVEKLIPLLRHEDAEVWGLALELLEYHNDPAAIPAVLEAAADEQIGLAVAAADVLRYFRNPGADRELIAGLRHESLPVRLAAISALRERRSLAALEPLVSLLGDIHAEIRKEAVITLASYQRQDLLLAVRSAVRDGDPTVRRIAVESLADFENAAVFGDLLTALSDEGWQVRREAARALARVPGQATAYALRMALEDSSWQVVAESLTSLGRISAAVDRQILALLHHGIPEVRAAAAAAVGQSNDPGLVPYLGALLQDPDQAVAKSTRLSISRLNAIASETNSL
jgi:HEAT repeat protein